MAIDAARGDTEADDWAAEVDAQLTEDERFGLLSSLMVVVFGGAREPRVPEDVPQTAGYVPGVPRLGVPDLLITDAGLGVTNPQGGRPGDTATCFPAGLAWGASFNPALAEDAGAAVGAEAASRGFNVLCGGGMNLVRDPRCGRNFEYISEDPLVSGVVAGASVRGNQASGVISMVKHFSLNSHETNKFWLDAVIDPAAHRESDLLAFQIAFERGDPGSVMGAYNLVNGEYCCGNRTLLDDVLRGAFGFRGWAMSDWMAVHDWRYALAGLDQHSGAQLDAEEWFAGPLREQVAAGEVPPERIHEMARRILRTVRRLGVDDPSPPPSIDLEAHDRLALEVARQGMVLLANDGILPLPPGTATVALIGGHSDRGVLAGGGSSQGAPPNGVALKIPYGGLGFLAALNTEVYYASPPLAELRRLLPDATVEYDPGVHAAQAVALARRCDVAVVVVTKFETEGFDTPDLTLPHGQDALIAAVAAANPDTIVVLETGNPVTMPWLGQVRAVLQAWYPGQAGGRAIAEVLTGAVNPSGRLPITFPASVDQLPRPRLAGLGDPFRTPLTIHYDEGSEVGYRWFAATGAQPLFAFGHGLGYTTFEHSDLGAELAEPDDAAGGPSLVLSVTVTNVGARRGADVVQAYLRSVDGGTRCRLLGFERVELEPGERRRVAIDVDPRLLADFDAVTGRWHVVAGSYRVEVAAAADLSGPAVELRLRDSSFGS